MNNTENKVVDLTIEANIPFALLMRFEDVQSLLGEEEVFSPVNLTGYTFKGVIKDSLESNAVLIETFTISIVTAADGIVSISLTNTQTANVAAKASPTRDKYNPRLRFVGYYDIIISKTSTGANFRALEGKVYISDGVTK